MGKQHLRSISKRRHASLAGASSLAGCVSLILHGAAVAQEAGPQKTADASAALEVITVTASRREVALSEAPFNISAYDSSRLEAAGITSMTGLSTQVPNFVIEDSGERDAASTIPIMRGLNASQATAFFDGARAFQSPVGFYIGNTPIVGVVPLVDIERVEVLRGPQGTLYGSGTLAGAVRVVPMAPELGVLNGEVSGSLASTNHSADMSYETVGVLNVPIGETLALRAVARYAYDAGFIDQNDIMRRENGDYRNGIPVLADPSNVAWSQPVWFDKSDVNYSKNTAARVSMLWQPTDAFQLDAAFSYTRNEGNGAPVDTYKYGGGKAPIDLLPDTQEDNPYLDYIKYYDRTGEFELTQTSLEPFDRDSYLGSVDGSYDLGFATLSGTLSYGDTQGTNVIDGAKENIGNPFSIYYTGYPINPRFAFTYANEDKTRVYSQELRLVSNGENLLDYVVGAFFQQETRDLDFFGYNPGATEQAAAAGGFVYVYPEDQATFRNLSHETFDDYALYGNLTWNINDLWQVTGGARVFHQNFTAQRDQDIALLVGSGFPDEYHYPKISHDDTSAIFMMNTSYELAASWNAYATWSQGYRRGGANSYPIVGPFAETPDLLLYDQDTTNNFELGIKGYWDKLYLSLAAFYVDWKDPQIDMNTPYLGNFVVVNANKAASQGFELEMSGPLGSRGLSFDLGIAYARARLTEDFALPAADGMGGTDPTGIVGKDGDPLPGAPDWSGTANVYYQMTLADSSAVTFSLGAVYRSAVWNELPSTNPGFAIADQSPAYWLFSGNVEWSMDEWRLALYGTNLLDRHVVYSQNVRNPYSVESIGTYGDVFTVATPRQIGLRATYQWR